jgi:Domain of unknown function (DUF5054)
MTSTFTPAGELRRRPAASTAAIALLLLLAGGRAARAHGPASEPAGVAPYFTISLNQPSAAIEDVEQVDLVIMSHLDVGYTGFAIDVINTYFQQYFPEAIDYAARIADDPNPDLRAMGYVFTSHPWLISLYLDCPQDLIPALACPNAQDREAFIAALDSGVIGWEGYTFNLQAALMDPSLYRFALDMTRRLDERFHKRPTLTVSLRDVPGSTRAMLPLLLADGYTAVSVGVNGAVVSAAVSPAFVWRDGIDGRSVLALVHPGGYGGVKLQDCVVVAGLKVAQCVWVTGDNAGPPAPGDVAQVWRILVKQFPQAKVKATGFDHFTRALETVRASLPVVDQEIGDTWLSGPPADPGKLTSFREMSRARAECFAAGRCPADDPDISDFSRLLLKAPEHTAGISSTGVLQDYSKDWSNPRFEQVRDEKEFRYVESSWSEQRRFLDWALAALDRPHSSPAAKALHADITARLAAITPRLPSTAGYTPVDPAGPFACGTLELGFDAATGAIDHLVDLRTGRNWASPPLAAKAVGVAARPFLQMRRMDLERDLRTKRPELSSTTELEPPPPFGDGNPLALFLYRTYDALDYYFYLRQYSYEWPPNLDSLSLAAFYKPGVETAHPRSSWWLPALRSAWRKSDGSCDFLLELGLPAEAHASYGAPASAWVQVAVPPGGSDVNVDFQWFDKTTTRLPESLWMAFRPIAPNADGWRFQTLGELLPVTTTVVNGSRHLGAVWGGLSYCDPGGELFVESRDATVVSPGLPSLVDYNNQAVEPREGMFVDLATNVWNTNWPLWYPWLPGDENSRFRFTLHLDAGCAAGRWLPPEAAGAK